MKIFFKNKQKVYIREIENYKNFHHPLCPKFFGSGKINSWDFILLEFIQGKTLKEVNINDLTYNDKMKYILEILIIFENIHKNHYIYRDLTPHNIIIEQNSNTIMLVDFDRMIKDDLEVSEKEITQDFNGIFKSPEILACQKVSNKTDIYSIGMIIKYFFDKKTIQKSPIIRKIINSCIKKNPEERPNISTNQNENSDKKVMCNFYCKFSMNLLNYSETSYKKFSQNFSKNRFIMLLKFDFYK